MATSNIETPLNDNQLMKLVLIISHSYHGNKGSINIYLITKVSLVFDALPTDGAPLTLTTC